MKHSINIIVALCVALSCARKTSRIQRPNEEKIHQFVDVKCDTFGKIIEVQKCEVSENNALNIALVVSQPLNNILVNFAYNDLIDLFT